MPFPVRFANSMRQFKTPKAYVSSWGGVPNILKLHLPGQLQAIAGQEVL